MGPRVTSACHCSPKEHTESVGSSDEEQADLLLTYSTCISIQVSNLPHSTTRLTTGTKTVLATNCPPPTEEELSVTEDRLKISEEVEAGGERPHTACGTSRPCAQWSLQMKLGWPSTGTWYKSVEIKNILNEDHIILEPEKWTFCVRFF